MNLTLRRLSALAITVVALGGCSVDQPTAATPQRQLASPAAPQGNLQGTLNALTAQLSVKGLQRTIALKEHITVSKVIGANGGTLSIPQAGVTVTVPRGAVSVPTTITMTARKGKLVAYDFGPHGIAFAQPLVLTQQLRGTNATPLMAALLSLAYYTDATQLTDTDATVKELLGGIANVTSWSFTGKINHFSGYMVSCGRR